MPLLTLSPNVSNLSCDEFYIFYICTHPRLIENTVEFVPVANCRSYGSRCGDSTLSTNKDYITKEAFCRTWRKLDLYTCEGVNKSLTSAFCLSFCFCFFRRVALSVSTRFLTAAACALVSDDVSLDIISSFNSLPSEKKRFSFGISLSVVICLMS